MSDSPLPLGPEDGGGSAPSRHDALVEKRRSRSRTRRVLIGLAVLLGLLGVGAVVAWQAVNAQIRNSIEWLDDPFEALPTRPPVVTPTPPSDGSAVVGPPVNILFLGSDSRISAGDPTQWEAGAQRTDAIMLLHIPANREEVYVMSIPRDSWVPIPGHGDAKINAAFSYGGPTLMIQTVEQLTGVHIDHFAVVDFQSFAKLTDMFGGVEITIPDTTYDRRRHETIPAGTYQMNGEEALDYVRQRYGLPGGDFDRVERHQNWIRAVAVKAMDQGALDNPAEITRILLAVSEFVSTDEAFTIDAQRDLAYSLRGIEREQDLNLFTAPVAGTGWSPDGRQSIVRLDNERLSPLVAAIADDTIENFLNNHPDYQTLGETVN